MKKLDRLQIQETLEEISLWDLEGSLDDAIAFFQKRKKEYGNRKDLKLSKETRYGYDDSTDYLVIYYMRDETDEEYNNRINLRKSQEEAAIKNAMRLLKAHKIKEIK